MAKKEWTPEERAAFGAKMKAAKAAKNKNPQNEKVEEQAINPSELPAPEAPAETVADSRSSSEMEMLLARIQELEASAWRNRDRGPQTGTSVTQEGKQLGSTERYPLEAGLYPDPGERLSEEPRLARFAFPENYELNFVVDKVSYTNLDGIRMKEPKFILELIRKMYDPETGELTSGRYIVCRLIMHEDPDAALEIADANGIKVDENDQMHFLNEMRYLRMRDWLLEAFYAIPPAKTQDKRDMVINGQLVEYFEVNSEDTSAIPFNQLKTKIR